MCLILLSYKNHHEFPFVLAANRDEFYKRPTEAAKWWKSAPDLLGGRDLEGGGTWLALSKKGKFAAITNYRDPSKIIENAPTRGTLISDFLDSDIGTQEYLEILLKGRENFNGYNLLFGTIDDLWYYSNISGQSIQLRPGIYGLSNELLDSPWPKVKSGKEKVTKLIMENNFNADVYFEALSNNEIASDKMLPTTGVPLEWERALSPMFIKMEKYGTRCSTFITVDKNDDVYYEERGYVPASNNLFRFSLKKT